MEFSTKEVLIKSTENIIKPIGANSKREGLKKTPERFTNALLYLTKGYKENIKTVVGDGIFQCDTNDPIIIKDIEFNSLCEHHMSPFLGKVHIGYIPNGKILGLSKFAKIVEMELAFMITRYRGFIIFRRIIVPSVNSGNGVYQDFSRVHCAQRENI